MVIRATDIWPGLVLLCLGIYIVYTSQHWIAMSDRGPGPGFFPLVEGIAIIALSGAILIRSAVKAFAGESLIQGWQSCTRPVATGAVLFGSALLLDVLGFMLSFALVTLFVVVVMYRRSLFAGLATAIGSTAGLYIVFVLALGLRLPTGWLGF